MNVAHWRAYVRGFPAGLLGMLAIAAAVEGFVGRHGLDLMTAFDWQCVRSKWVAERLAQRYDVLCFGDSLIKYGVLPRVLGARGGLRAHNLAVVGGQAPSSYLLLRRALAGGARPAAVLVDFYPKLLADGPGRNSQPWPHLFNGAEALDLGLRRRDAGLLGRLVAGRLMPSVRTRFGLREWVKSALAGTENSFRLTAPGTLLHLVRYDGAVVMDPTADFKNVRDQFTGCEIHAGQMYPADWTPDPVNRGYVKRFLRLAAARGVTVYWLLPPAFPGMQATLERSGFDARLVGFVRALQARHPNLVVLDGRHAGYGPKAFIDGDHLAREGACVLSEDLGAVLARLAHAPPPPDRWVTLPAYRARPVDPSIETIEMTQVAFMSSQKAVR
jgi:hypothetical protein